MTSKMCASTSVVYVSGSMSFTKGTHACGGALFFGFYVFIWKRLRMRVRSDVGQAPG